MYSVWLSCVYLVLLYTTPENSDQGSRNLIWRARKDRFHISLGRLFQENKHVVLWETRIIESVGCIINSVRRVWYLCTVPANRYICSYRIISISSLYFSINVSVYLCCIPLIDPTKTIFKDNERTSMNERNTFLYKKYISLILFSKGAHSLLLVWERDGETYTQWGDFSWSHNFFLEPRCANACNPLQDLSSERT